jgi:hypothetical protein
MLCRRTAGPMGGQDARLSLYNQRHTSKDLCTFCVKVLTSP